MIDSDVPVPAEKDVIMPLATLEVGQSILFAIDRRNSVQSQASALKRRTGKIFTVRKVDEGHGRVWRKE